MFLALEEQSEVKRKENCSSERLTAPGTAGTAVRAHCRSRWRRRSSERLATPGTAGAAVRAHCWRRGRPSTGGTAASVGGGLGPTLLRVRGRGGGLLLVGAGVGLPAVGPREVKER